MNKSICGYSTKEYTFRYRGVALTSDSFEDISKQMSKDMQEMLLLLDGGRLDELFAEVRTEVRILCYDVSSEDYEANLLTAITICRRAAVLV